MINLPVLYSLRNVKRRPWHSVMTIVGIAVIVFASVVMLSLARGLHRRVSVTGEERNILVLSSQGQNLMFSSISEDELVHLSSLPGIAVDAFGLPLVSPEIMHMSMMEVDAEKGAVKAPVYVRGVTDMSYEVHRSVRVVQGRLPEDENEILVGKTTHAKMKVPENVLAPGRTVRFENEEWMVSGIFEAGGALIESEMWMDAAAMKRILRRRSYTFAVIRMTDETAVAGALPKLRQTGALERYFKGWSERGYYEEFGSVLGWVLSLSAIMVIAITVSGALIGANTMYTAVMNRMREIATYRVLGFGKSDILVSFMTESLALAVFGGILGLGAGLCMNGLPLRLSYGAFYLVVDAVVCVAGLCLAVLIGVVGGILPVIQGLRLTIPEGLRHG